MLAHGMMPGDMKPWIAATSVILLASILVTRLQAVPAQNSAAGANCVALGAPKPALSYTYRYTDTQGSTEYTNQWKQFSATGSQLLTTRANGRSTYVSKHSVANDLFVLESSVASGTDPGGAFNNSMTYSPGAIGDPAYKACEGQTWSIPAVKATSASAQGSFSTTTDPGTLTIVKVHESVTVPAGTFDTVRYRKTMGKVIDEFWKSIEHGVTVKRNSAQPGGIATEILIAIK
jgi:hypothetical protein